MDAGRQEFIVMKVAFIPANRPTNDFLLVYYFLLLLYAVDDRDEELEDADIEALQRKKFRQVKFT